MKISAADMIVWLLVTIGGLNWGLVGAFDFNLISSVLGEGSFLTRTLYILIALAAIWSFVAMFSRSSNTVDQGEV